MATVAEILIAVASNGGNWQSAFEELIPKRKGAKVKGDSANTGESGESEDDYNEAHAEEEDAAQ